MKITNVAIKYRTTMLVFTFLLVIGGLLSYTTIPKESFPSIEIPNIVVTTIYPGASPDDVESLLTEPIEQEIQGINGIKEIRSTSVEGVSSIVVEFNPDVSMDDAFQKVRDKVDVAKSELPDDVEEPIVSEIDFSEFPVMTVNLAAPYSLARLKEVADNLSDELEAIPSVLEVPVTGGLTREVQINVNLNALQGYNLTFDDIISTVRQENTNLPGGSVDVDRLNYLIRIDGEFENPEEEIKDLVIESKDGTPVYVRDVADVVFGYQKRSSYARLRVLKFEDDEDHLTVLPADEVETLQVVSLGIKKRSGSNILETAAEVEAVLAAFPMPAGTQVAITGDQSEQVEAMVKDLENNIIAGIIFVIFVLLFFLGVRNATLVGIAIPLSMFITFIVFQLMGQTLNFIILFSLIIALGMLVDNAVVIVENIFRFREQGYSRFEAARLGTAEVAGAVIASTATTIAAFGPMLFWPGLIGEFMGYLPLTLIITLASSLFVAILINPVITGIFIRLEDEDHPERPRIIKIIGAVTIFVMGLVLAFASYKALVVLVILVPLLILLHRKVMAPIGRQFVQQGLPRVIASYRNFLHWMLERDYSNKTPIFARRSAKVIAIIATALAVLATISITVGATVYQSMMMVGFPFAIIAAVLALVLLALVNNSMFRNTLALGSFTGGFLLLILGGIIAGLAGNTAAMILLVPGGLLLVIGILGLIFHSLESVYLGGRSSVKAGLIFGGISLFIAGLMYLSPREVELVSIINLMILPAIIVLVGFLGMLFNRRERLVLTDNRSRLMTGVLGSLFAILAMFVVANPGTEFFPDTDPNLINITLEAPLGTNPETSNRIAEQAEAAIVDLLDQSDVDRANLKNISIGVGVSADAAFGGGASSAERSRLTLNMVDYADRQASSKITMTHLREQLQGIPGVEIEFAKDDAGPPTGAPVNIEISGEDFDEISRITREIRQRLVEASETGAIPGLVDVADNLNAGRPELRVKVDRERAGRFGLNTFQVANTVRAAINGIEASKYRTGEDEYDIIVRLAEDERASLESVKNLTIMNEEQQIPITAVADLEVGGGLGSVTRLDLKRVATVTGEAAPGYNAQAVLAQVQAHLADYQVPPGYDLAYTGENEEQADAFGFLTTALLIGIALIFMIMIAQFNSVSGPFIIMVAVGLSLIGVLLGLLLTRTPFGLMTFIGVISLAGIVVNNNIVLIDYTIQLRQRGMEKQQAIIEGGATRLRPVVLTALTTVIGLVPLTFGINIDFVGLLTDWDPNFAIGSENTQFWGPMGTAIISGLTFATFLTLVIVPVMYSIFDSLGLRLGTLFSSNQEEEDLVPAGDGYGVPASGSGPEAASYGNGTAGNGSSYKPEIEEDPKPSS